MRSIRRFRSAAGLFAVALLIAASGCGTETPDQPGSAPATDATDSTDAPSVTEAPPVTDSIESAQTMTSTAVAVSAPFDAMLEESEYVPVRWLVPWDDGFLAAGVRYPPQPLPDQLPPELAALFPPEVTALFPDGLPPTLEEARDTLREAGLLDVVMDILNEHPEAMDAVQSAPPPEPELLASWSADGVSWIPVEVAPPGAIADNSQLAVSGDRLTVAGASDDDGGTSMVTVASTTDLENWTTADFALTQPEGLPATARTWVNPTAVAADDEHWVVRFMIDEIADPTSGSSVSQPRTELWSGAWGGEPARSDAGQQSWILLATSEGFLDLGEGVTFSPDGQTWTDVPGPAPNVLFQTAAPLGDDVLAVTGTLSGEGTPPFESSIVVLDASGSMTDEVEIAELANGFSTWSSTSSPAFIVQPAMPAPVTQIVVEHDGFELTQEYSNVVAYQLVELSTGDVVVEESVDLRTTEITEDGPFEYFAEDTSGITISDPETGATIVEIPRSTIDRAREEARGGDDETTLGGGQPNLWLLATADAVTWLLEDLEQAPDGSNGPMLAAANGTTVLVGTPGSEPGTDVWQRFSMQA
jgi:hypothetical protein